MSKSLKRKGWFWRIINQNETAPWYLGFAYDRYDTGPYQMMLILIPFNIAVAVARRLHRALQAKWPMWIADTSYYKRGFEDGIRIGTSQLRRTCVAGEELKPGDMVQMRGGRAYKVPRNPLPARPDGPDGA